MQKFLAPLVLLVLSISLAACGGGGSDGGSDSGDPVRPPVSNDEEDFSEPVIQIDAPLSTVDRASMRFISGSTLAALELARQTYGLWWKGDLLQQLDKGVTRDNCDHKGSFELEVNSDRTRMVERYDQCGLTLDGELVTVNGRVLTEFSGIGDDGTFRVRSVYRDYSVANSMEEELLEAVIVFNGGISAGSDFQPSFDLNLRADNTVDGTLRVKNFRFQLDDGGLFSESLSTIHLASGQVALDSHINVMLNGSEQDRIDVQGAGAATGSLELRNEGVAVALDVQPDGQGDYSLFFPMAEIDGMEFFSAAESVPELRRTFVEEAFLKELLEDESFEFSVLDYFRNSDGRLLEFRLDISQILPENAFGEEREGFVAPEYQLGNLGGGDFQFSAGGLNVNEVRFYFEGYAQNAAETESPEPLEFDLLVLRDTDGDGQPDKDDSDDDNDGISDYDDVFPKDRSESRDTDGDGVGDNRDEDADNDGVADEEDDYPLDRLCHLASDGNGERCRLWDFSSPIWSKNIDRNGVVYYFSDYGREVWRWDSTTGHFLETLELDPRLVGANSNPDYLFYSEAQHVLYAGYLVSGLTKIDLNSEPYIEVPFIQEPVWLGDQRVLSFGLDMSGDGIVFSGRALDRIYRAFDNSGSLLDTYNRSVWGENLDPQYIPFEIAPFCRIGMAFNQDIGLFALLSAAEETPDTDVCGEMRSVWGIYPVVSPDGNRAVIADGSIIDPAGNVLSTQTIPLMSGHVFWTTGGIYTIDSDETTVSKFDPDGNWVSNITIPEDFNLDEVLANHHHIILYDHQGAPLVIRSEAQ
ncbi:thrombospondin type 3 repeat-containing protein [Microbulbifer sp. ALW1]|uniref:thrombospondin type 3 repeat-containing protein n=1 Tax=Microbulbifer sp. (strain ALW1) TaxID=1516059 RepID=UPI00135AD0D4|nr:thrombospondin type 3 repeat-containing protein [Microbulbifer sp. ALW1]